MIMMETKNQGETINQDQLDISILLDEKMPVKQWSEKLIQCCEDQSQKFIEHVLREKTDINSIIEATIPFLIDQMYRKESIKIFFTKLKIFLRGNHKKLFEEIKLMEFSDFMFLCSEKIHESPLFGFLQSEMGIPLQFYNEKNMKIFYNPELLKEIMGFNKFSIIFHTSTKAAQKEDRIGFIYKLWKFKENYKYKKQTSLCENSIFVHNLKKDGLLLHFNGHIDEHKEDIPRRNIFENSTHLLLHVEEEEVLNSETNTVDENFLKKINLKFPNVKKTIIFIWNSLCLENGFDESMSQQNIRFVCLNDEANDEDFETFRKVANELNFFQQCLETSYGNFLYGKNTQKEIEENEKEANRIISLLPTGNERSEITETYFPHIFLINKINEFKRKIEEIKDNLLMTNDEEKKEMYSKIKEIEEKIEGNEKALEKVQLSKFVELIFDRVKSEDEFGMDSNMISQKLYEWKRKTVAPNLEEFVDLSNKIKEEENELNKQTLQKKLTLIEKKIEECDISLTTILNEIVIKCEKNFKINAHTQTLTSEVSIINKIYRSSIEKMIPINLVEGKNLTFGNKFLRELFEQLSTLKKYQNKKIYIVSIIGAQSTAKSTLLNYLFRSKFETSAGRCTKGMYFNICECGDRIIMVIDTEGLLSVSSHDHVFDNRIATFVLSISNLVILNHKGELNSNQRDLLYICMFAMKFLRNEKKFSNEKPEESQRVFFVLRDQRMPIKGEKHQEQILGKFMEEFEDSQKYNINYRDYLNIRSEDIFCFPNAIDNDINKFGMFESYSEIFGSCVRGLRSQIMEALDSSKKVRSSLIECYEEAEYYWNTILKCGSDLMNYKVKLELESKIQIENKYNEICGEESQKLESLYEVEYDRFKDWDYESLKNSEEKDIQPIFQNLRINWEGELQTKLKQICLSFCREDEWLKSCNDKIVTKSFMLYNFYSRKIKNLILSKKQDEDKQSLENVMKQKIAEMINNFVNESKTLKEFEKIKTSFLVFEEEAINLKQVRFEIEKHVKETFHDLKTTDYEQSQKEIERKLKEKNGVGEFLKLYFKSNWKEFLFRSEDNDFLFNILTHLENKIEENCRTNGNIVNLVKSKQFHKIKVFETDLKAILSDAYSSAVQKINKKKQSCTLGFHFELKEKEDPQIKEMLTGALIKSIFHFFNQTKKEEDLKKKKEKEELVKIYEKKLKEALASKGNYEKTSENWMKSIVDKLEKNIQNSVEKKVENEFKELEKRFDSEKLIQEAFKLSFKKVESGKSKWIECFKFVANKQKYLFEIMCKDSLIMNRIVHIETIIKQEVGVAAKEFQDLIIFLEEIMDEKDKSMNEKRIKTIKDSYSLVSIQNKDDEIILFKYLLKILTPSSGAIESVLRTKINLDEFLSKATDFIKNDLSDIIFGCKSRCPFCEIKCTLPRGHNGDHTVLQNCHIMLAFSGMLEYSGTPAYSLCMTERELERGFYEMRTSEGISIQEPTMKYLENHYPSWEPYFKSMKELKNYQTEFDHEAFKEIWANISEILIKYIFTDMKDDKKFEDRKKEELTEDDLDKYKYIDINGQQQPIRDYVRLPKK